MRPVRVRRRLAVGALSIAAGATIGQVLHDRSLFVIVAVAFVAGLAITLATSSWVRL